MLKTTAENQFSVHTKSLSEQSPPSTYREAISSQNTLIELDAITELFTELGDILKLSRLDTCRTNAYFVRDKLTNLVKVVSTSCHVKFCPYCAKARSFSIKKNTASWLKSAEHPKFITLTLKHSELDLSEQFERLYSCFKDLRRLKLWKSKIVGAIWFFEVKFNDKNEWHPHLHIVADGKYLSQRQLSKEWERLTTDSPVVDIRSVKDPKKVSDYVAKYATKPCQLNRLKMPQRIELYKSLQKRRLCGTVGTAFKMKLTAKPDFDKANFEKIGAWSTVIGLMGFHDYADKIYFSYQTKLPIDPEISCTDIDYFIIGKKPIELSLEKSFIKEKALW